MSVYVDGIRRYPNAIGLWNRGSCHLMADSTAELEEVARAIGLRPDWIQCAGTAAEHYDLTPAARDRAIDAGAVECGRDTIARLLRREACEIGEVES